MLNANKNPQALIKFLYLLILIHCVKVPKILLTDYSLQIYGFFLKHQEKSILFAFWHSPDPQKTELSQSFQ